MTAEQKELLLNLLHSTTTYRVECLCSCMPQISILEMKLNAKSRQLNKEKRHIIFFYISIHAAPWQCFYISSLSFRNTLKFWKTEGNLIKLKGKTKLFLTGSSMISTADLNTISSKTKWNSKKTCKTFQHFKIIAFSISTIGHRCLKQGALK